MVTLTTLTALLSQLGGALPAITFALVQLFEVFQRDNPEMTEADYVQYLLTGGKTVQNFSASWLLAHGYTQDADGKWTKVG